MTDQPTNQAEEVATNYDHGRDQPADDHTTMPAWVTMDAAASMLGITVNAVRQRVKRGTLTGRKTDDGWLVDMSTTTPRPTTHAPPTTAANQPTNHATMPADQQPTIDLAPLAEVIRDQNRRLEELSSAAAFWQVRAQQAEEQLKQLTAGTERGEVSQEAVIRPESEGPEAPEPPVEGEPERGTAGILVRLRRWLIGTD